MICIGRPFARALGLLATMILSGCNSSMWLRPNPPDDGPALQVPESSARQDRPAAAVTTDLGIGSGGDGAEGNSGDAGPGDLWDRIREGYGLKHRRDLPRVNNQINWYSTKPEHLKRVEEYARPYLHHVVEELDKRDMPMELAFLPIVESAYKPYARSPDRAAGIWQFMPSTGKMFGLKQNWWYDGRRDILASTEAALDYLESLAEQFDGDWELAMAAYNAGAGAVRRAMRKNRQKGKPTDYWSLDLPRETRRYVPRLLAVAVIVQNPGEYGLSLDPIPDEPYFDSVDIEAQLDLTLAAEMAGMELEELYQLNPGYKRWATDPEGPHRILLPLDQIDGFNAKFSELDPNERIRWSRYVIQRGDTLSAIARKYDTTVAVLKQSNHLSNSRIRSGRALLIPQAAAGGQIENRTSAPPARTQEKRHAPPGSDMITHTVQRGDSLWEIARSYNVSHKALARWNGISVQDTLHPGQKLVIWTRNRPQISSVPNHGTWGRAGAGRPNLKIRSQPRSS